MILLKITIANYVEFSKIFYKVLYSSHLHKIPHTMLSSSPVCNKNFVYFNAFYKLLYF